MPRTTIDIDGTVLRELKRRQRREDTTLSALVSRLLARALRDDPTERPPLRWKTQEMGARVDLDDDEALRRVLDRR